MAEPSVGGLLGRPVTRQPPLRALERDTDPAVGSRQHLDPSVAGGRAADDASVLEPDARRLALDAVGERLALGLEREAGPGETVRVVVAGPGFSLESEGQALSNGVDGQPARVRLENGRIVSGSPAGDRRVQVLP